MGSTGDRRASLESVLVTAIETYLKDVHTMLPGQIIKFDPATQLADVQIQLKRNNNGELITLPVLSQVPVRFLKSGDFTITFPLKENDEVAIYFMERSIDNWLEDGGIQSPNDVRRFDLSDAYVVPILYSQKQKITDFDPDNMVIKSTNGNSKITLKTDGTILMETTANTEITSAKTIINNDVDINGNLKVDGTIDATGTITAPDVVGTASVTAPTVSGSSSLTVAGVEVGSHTHGGVSTGTGTTLPLS